MLILNTTEFKKYGSEQDLKYLLAILTAKNIPYRLEAQAIAATTTSAERASPADKKISKDSSIEKMEKKLIYENDVLKLFLQQTQTFPNFFIFEPKAVTQHNIQLFDENIAAFFRFLKQQGFLQYCILQNQQDKSVTVLPVPDSGNIVDVNSKIVNSLRFFFGAHALVNFNILPSSHKYKASRKDKSFSTLIYPRTSFWTQIEALEHNVNNAILAFLQDHNIIQFNTKPFSATSKGSETFVTPSLKKPKTFVATKKIQRDAPSCAFCTPEIIKKQLVLDLGNFVLLVNYQPYAASKAHFLIVPQHIEDWSHLNQEQRETLQKIVTGVVKSIQANCNVSAAHILSYVQNGVTAGQTVPGSHLHVFSKPKLLPFLLDIGHQMLGQRGVVLTPPEMATIAAKFKPEILQSLWYECSPRRLMIDPPSAPQAMLTAYAQNKTVNKTKNAPVLQRRFLSSKS